MRAKVILAAAVLGGVVLSAAFYLHNRQNQPPSDTTTDTVAAAPAQEPAAAPQSAPSPRKLYGFRHDDSSLPDDRANAEPGTAAHRDYVAEQESALADLSANGDDDPGSRAAAEAQLRNREPAIRKAAVNALVQMGSPDAIPALQNAMLYADDPIEKAEIQKAIDFLQLPSL